MKRVEEREISTRKERHEGTKAEEDASLCLLPEAAKIRRGGGNRVKIGTEEDRSTEEKAKIQPRRSRGSGKAKDGCGGKAKNKVEAHEKKEGKRESKRES